MTTSLAAHPALPSPLRWVGGKSRLRAQILPLIPPHTTYAEPYGGGAWVLFGKRRSAVEVYNDLDGDVSTFFRVLRDQPDALIRRFDWTLVSRETFETLKGTDPATLSDLDRAYRLYYLIMAGWGGELGSPRFQTAVHDAGGGNRLLGALRDLPGKLRPAAQRLQGVHVEQRPALDIIRTYDAPDAFFYVDPPYPGNGCNYAVNMRDLDEHRALADVLARVQGRWLLSTYDRPDLIELYGGSFTHRVQSASGMAASGGEGRVQNREVLIGNYTPAHPAPMPGLFGPAA